MPAEIPHIVLLVLLMNVDRLNATHYIRACFFKSTSRIRYNEATFSVENIDFTLCTHYIYGSANLHIQDKSIMAADRIEEEGPKGLYRKFNAAKNDNPKIKTILSVGGAQNVHAMAFEALYSKDPDFQEFPRNALAYIRDKGFDGLNIHWEIRTEHLGKIVFTNLLKGLRDAFDKDYTANKLLLTITGHAIPYIVHSTYNVPEIEKYVDYVFVAVHNLVLPGRASFIGPLFHNPQTGNLNPGLNMNASLHQWNKEGMPYHKLVLCVTALANYIKLKDEKHHKPGSLAETKIVRGPSYYIDNRLAYPEVCRMMNTSQKYYDNIQKNAYLVRGFEWVGYTDTASLEVKIQFMRALGLAGIMLYDLDEDDFTGNACNAGKSPLFSFIRDALDPLPATHPTTSTPATEVTTSRRRMSTTTTTTTTTPAVESAEAGNDYLLYVFYIVLYVLGFVIGLAFMRFVRSTIKLYDELH